ncbi:MAG TPA: gephyrin-like molybdotransferase Glp [Oscillatoriaceae cyanobacterium]
MLSVEEAFRTIVGQFRPLETERVPLREACDRVLAEDVRSPEPVPPFDNSAMDGYAVRFEDTLGASAGAPVALFVVGEVPAGRAPEARVEPGTAVRVMTGAPMPEGADAVVMREDTREHPDRVEVLLPAEHGEHVRRVGDDIPADSRVLEAGTVLNPSALGVLASIGVGRIAVVRRPRVALLATGDELVELGQPLGPGQIRNSSAHALEAAIAAMGAVPVPLGIARDDRAELTAKLHEGARADLLVTTGGVSVGDYDLVREVLTSLGQLDLWRVNMQPGKPLAFGHIDGCPVLGLPGNPVSSMVAFELFVRPAIRRLQGHTALAHARVPVVLDAPMTKKNARRQYLRAVVRLVDGAFHADLTGPQGSHMLTSMARANALVILPEGTRSYAAGDRVEGHLLGEGALFENRDSDAV